MLTAQEIRHAMNQGIAADYVASLAEMDSFKRATCNIIKTERMEDRDFVTRYVSFFLQDYAKFQLDLDSFLTKRMAKIKSVTQEEREEMKENFDKAMRTSMSVFGDNAFRKRQNPTDRRKPINKALFEVLSVYFAKLPEAQSQLFISKNDNKEHYEVFDNTGNHLGEAEMNGVLDETKKDKTKSIRGII